MTTTEAVLELFSGLYEPELLLGPHRWQPLARDRQLAYWLLDVAGVAGADIARAFHRQPATVYHGIRATEQRLRGDGQPGGSANAFVIGMATGLAMGLCRTSAPAAHAIITRLVLYAEVGDWA